MACLDLLCKKHVDSTFESTFGINASLNVDPGSMSATVEANCSLFSPCKDTALEISSLTYAVGLGLGNNEPPLYFMYLSVQTEIGDLVEIGNYRFEVVNNVRDIEGKISLRLEDGPILGFGQSGSGKLFRIFCLEKLPHINKDMPIGTTLETFSCSLLVISRWRLRNINV